MTATRILIARRELHLASSAADALPPAAALLAVATALGGGVAADPVAANTGQANTVPANTVPANTVPANMVRAGALLDEVIRYLRAAAATLSADRARGGDHKLALYLLAQAALLRDRDDGLVADIDDAIGCLRGLRAQAAAGTAERAEIDTSLGTALLNRAGRLGNRLADLDESARLLESVLGNPLPGTGDTRWIRALLALQRAIRFASHGGRQADCDAALDYAGACLAEPGSAPGDQVTVVGHVVSAWMLIVRHLTPEQRALTAVPAAARAFGAGRASAEELARRLGPLHIPEQDTATAIAHLRQVPDDTDESSALGYVPLLWSMALLAAAPAEEAAFPDSLAADVTRVAGRLGRMPPSGEPDDLTPGELRAMQAALLSVQARGADRETAEAATAALSDAAHALPADHLLRPSVLDALAQTVDRQVAQAGADGDITGRLSRLLDDMDRMPHDDPAFQRSLVAVGMHMLSLGGANRELLQADWLTTRLQQSVAALDPADPLLRSARYLLSAVRLATAVAQQQLDAVETAIDDLTRQVAETPVDYPTRLFMLAGVAIAHLDRASVGGELRHLRPARRLIDQAAREVTPDELLGEDGKYHSLLLFISGHLAAVEAYHQGSQERAAAAVTTLERAQSLLGRMPEGIPRQVLMPMVASSLRGARMLLATARDGGPAPGQRATTDHGSSDGTGDGTGESDALAVARSVDPRSPGYPMLLAQAAGDLMMRGYDERDGKAIDEAVRLLAEASSAGGLSLQEKSRLLELHGGALHVRYRLTWVPRDLSNAIDRLEEARRVVEQTVGSPHEASVLRSLSSAYRTRANAGRGDVLRATTLGLAALRKQAADVFLQDSEENALHMARHGSGEATEMARWFLDHQDGASAVSALELGRGTVLHAATASAGVEQVLREAGHLALADEWARAVREPAGDPDAAGDLRHRVMLAVEQTPAQARLLSAPAVSEIAAALTAAGNAALAYLLPRDDDGHGLAVIVGADGSIRRLPLPGLYTGGGSPVTAFLRTREAVEAAEAAEAAAGGSPESAAATAAARDDWLGALGTLCGWAWRTVIRPLLDTVRVPGGSGEPRLVLVPVAELGLVPWHAAREPVTGRYACQVAEFSYAPSARQFIDSSARRPRPWTQSPVLFSDVSGSLYLIAVGLAHLYTAHYQSATVFGYAHWRLDPAVAGGPAVSRDDVLNALPRAGAPGASLLHFGCHARSRLPVLNSSLDLGADADGNQVQVAVQDILARARAARSTGILPGEALGLVVLASCLTDVAESDFDETLTLATAFLAAGAAGVVAARWMVDAGATALFMNVFHQFLNVPGTRPARALRAAQLWMLDPGRDIPDAWPRALRDEAAVAARREVSSLASPQAWAGFTYQGW